MTGHALTGHASTRHAVTAGSIADGRATTGRGPAAIAAAFRRARDAGRVALIPYVVAGYPDAEGSVRAALTAIDAGADLLELGLPYSDPLADGATLQRASTRALAAGATLGRSIAQVAEVHRARPDVPLVVMGYLNQLVGEGPRADAIPRLVDAGASGLILADLTPDEGADVEAVAAASGLALIYLVTPTTPPERCAEVAHRTTGFLYAVSLVGVTGARRSLPSSVGRFLRGIRAVSPVPVAVGFGVSRPEQVRRLAADADGVIVASALVDSLGPDGRDTAALGRLVTALAAATRQPVPREAMA